MSDVLTEVIELKCSPEDIALWQAEADRRELTHIGAYLRYAGRALAQRGDIPSATIDLLLRRPLPETSHVLLPAPHTIEQLLEVMLRYLHRIHLFVSPRGPQTREESALGQLEKRFAKELERGSVDERLLEKELDVFEENRALRERVNELVAAASKKPRPRRAAKGKGKR